MLSLLLLLLIVAAFTKGAVVEGEVVDAVVVVLFVAGVEGDFAADAVDADIVGTAVAIVDAVVFFAVILFSYLVLLLMFSQLSGIRFAI